MCVLVIQTVILNKLPDIHPELFDPQEAVGQHWPHEPVTSSILSGVLLVSVKVQHSHRVLLLGLPNELLQYTVTCMRLQEIPKSFAKRYP